MAETRTGLDNWLGMSGTQYSQELVRQAARVASELVEQPTNGIPRTIDVVRKAQTQDANTALGVAAQWSPVAGLTGLSATLFLPNEWEGPRDETDSVRVKEGERSLLVADVPAAGTIPADRIMLTDNVKIDDPVYGEAYFSIESVNPIRGTGLIHVKVVYSRDGIT